MAITFKSIIYASPFPSQPPLKNQLIGTSLSKSRQEGF